MRHGRVPRNAIENVNPRSRFEGALSIVTIKPVSLTAIRVKIALSATQTEADSA